MAANCLWPRTLIATAAVQNLLGGDEAMRRARTPEIYADAAAEILRRDPRECTGNAYIDDEVLAEAGITDLDRYPGAEGPTSRSTCSWTARPDEARAEILRNAGAQFDPAVAHAIVELMDEGLCANVEFALPLDPGLALV